ncbi:MAG TPA: PEP-CTERM sorting domain-containing protein [Lacipirellulaceae bacterium]|jgi:DNA-binding beta-propeller fold protein YncE
MSRTTNEVTAKLLVSSATFLILFGLSASAALGQLYGINNDNGNLYKISTADASLALVGNTGIAAIGSLEYRPSDGRLYGFTSGSNPNLYRIDRSNANATLVGPLSTVFDFEGALVLAPNGTAYAANLGSSLADGLFTINLDTAAVTTIGTISGGEHDINGLAWRSDGMLVGLDRVTNSLLAINPSTAVSTLIAPISVAVGAVGGMASAGNSGYFATAGPSSGSNQLYSFDLFTGASTLIGSFSPTITGSGISGLALAVPEPSTIALCGLAGLAVAGVVARRRSTTP